MTSTRLPWRGAAFGSLVALAALAFATPASAAYAWHDFQFGGFASQGYLLSSDNDYLGNTSEGTADFREYAVNASWAKGKWRLGAQVFGEKLGYYGDDKLKLDWASVDFQATQWLGFRAGRVKLPRGLYNEALDLDAVRPFVLLPQSIYDNRLRDFNASFDGALAYGNIGLKQLGSVDYTVYYGDTPISVKSGASDFFNTDAPFPNTGLNLESMIGGTGFWNTPLNGLRVGYSYSTFKHFTADRDLVLPGMPPGFSVPVQKFAKHYDHHQLSVEYTVGDWTFAAEAARETSVWHIHWPTAPEMNLFYWINYKADLGYVSAARRINRWLELGTYYSVSREHYENHTDVPLPPLLKQNDFALSARFDVNDHMILKLEGHALDGTGKIFDTPTHPNPPTALKTSWTMVAAKMTVYF